MAIEKNQFIKYKPISGRLKEHFGFKLLADGNIKNADVYRIHCDKSFAYHGFNASLTYHLLKQCFSTPGSRPKSGSRLNLVGSSTITVVVHICKSIVLL